MFVSLSFPCHGHVVCGTLMHVARWVGADMNVHVVHPHTCTETFISSSAHAHGCETCDAFWCMKTWLVE